jgi:hypothetical protein
MRKNLLGCILVGLLFPLSAGADDVPPLTGGGCESFGFNFYRKLSATAPYSYAAGANMAISPLCLASVLQTFRLGASGQAEAELTRALEASAMVGKAREVVHPGAFNDSSI